MAVTRGERSPGGHVVPPRAPSLRVLVVVATDPGPEGEGDGYVSSSFVSEKPHCKEQFSPRHGIKTPKRAWVIIIKELLGGRGTAGLTDLKPEHQVLSGLDSMRMQHWLIFPSRVLESL